MSNRCINSFSESRGRLPGRRRSVNGEAGTDGSQFRVLIHLLSPHTSSLGLHRQKYKENHFLGRNFTSLPSRPW